MSWTLRALVLTATLVCGLAPQVACFMPDQTLTQPEADCCINNPGDCGQMDMSCCRPMVRSELGVGVKPIRNPMPHVAIAPKPLTVAELLPHLVPGDLLGGNDHAPPPRPGVSSLILRI